MSKQITEMVSKMFTLFGVQKQPMQRAHFLKRFQINALRLSPCNSCNITNDVEKTNLKNETPMATSNIDKSNNPFKQNELVPSIRGFKIASLNITSLPKHIDELGIAMKNNEIDVLAINESRMDNSIAPEMVTVHGYNWVSKDI